MLLPKNDTSDGDAVAKNSFTPGVQIYEIEKIVECATESNIVQYRYNIILDGLVLAHILFCKRYDNVTGKLAWVCQILFRNFEDWDIFSSVCNTILI
jgi:hypothetical protein